MTSAVGMGLTHTPGRVTLICEAGGNHNGDWDRARRMVEKAAEVGADAYKIQIRTLPDDLPDPDRMKTVPWTGEPMRYADYRRILEFTPDQIRELADLSRSLGMAFGASCWGTKAVKTLRHATPGGPDFYKVASASMTDHDLVEDMSAQAWEDGVPILMSTGALTMEQVGQAMDSTVAGCDVWLAQCTSTYPCRPEDINLRALGTLAEAYPTALLGFSNHSTSVAPIVGAVALGAQWVEVHFTLDRSLPGTDQSASFEPAGLRKIRSYVDTVSAALGDGVKRVLPEEERIMKGLRVVR